MKRKTNNSFNADFNFYRNMKNEKPIVKGLKSATTKDGDYIVTPFSNYDYDNYDSYVNLENGASLVKKVKPFTITENGTYNVNTINTVEVNVSGGGEPPVLVEKTITANGNYVATDDDADGYSQVSVNVRPNLINKIVTEAATYSASSEGADGYSQVSVETSYGNDVVFYDYDGTVLYHYSIAEYEMQNFSLDRMPTLPTHEGLTAVGWNWLPEAIDEYIRNHYTMGQINVGAVYRTNDGSTRFYFKASYDTTAYLSYYITLNEEEGDTDIEVDWGDGSPVESYSTETYGNASHSYQNAGNYKISVKILQGALHFTNGGGSSCYKVEIGNGINTIKYSAFNDWRNLETVMIPDTVTSIESNAFETYGPLNRLIIPDSIQNIESGGLSVSSSLSTPVIISLPYNLSSLEGNIHDSEGTGSIFGDTCIDSLTVPADVTAIPDDCCCVNVISLPRGLNTIGSNALGCVSSITISSVRSINSSAFSTYQLSIRSIRFEGSLPTISDSETLRVLDSCKIYIPEDTEIPPYYPDPNLYTYIRY